MGMLRVHHLDCGTMRPPGRRLVNGTGGPFAAATLVCHCLLIETDRGLVLVDTGFGTRDVERPADSLGAPFLRVARPALDPAQTALHQVARLGHEPRDVRHVVLTHLDLDHAGGIADFPWATVHVHAREHDAAMRPRTGGERQRYRPGQWAHGPSWATYDATEGESWFGFEAVRELDGLPPEILLIPLPGHTRGHSGVAVNTGGTWLLHAGDAYFFHGETDPVRPSCPAGLRLFQNLVQVDGPARRANVTRLRELREHDDVRVFCAHDPAELVPYTG